jgi:hypothetical protein
MTTTTIEGSVRVGDAPAAGADVLWIAPGMDRLLATATAGAGGRFRVEGAPPGDLLVRLAEPDRALIAHRHVAAGGGPVDVDLDLAAVAPVTLTAEIASDAGWPPVLDVFIDPEAVEQVPSGLGRFFHQKGPSVFAGHFLTIPVAGRSFSLELTPGTYRISGEYLNHDRPMMTNPTVENYLVSSVHRNGAPLPGGPYGGFRLGAPTDVHLRLVLRTVANDEL